MSQFVSVLGRVVPAKERVILVNQSNKTIKNPSAPYSKYADEDVPPGGQFIYEGPDRRACYELWQAGVDHFGQDFRKSPEFLQMLRALEFKTEKEYFKFMGIDIDEEKVKAEKTADVVTLHELPKKVEAIQVLGGGKDFSGGGQDRMGAFGLPKELG
jgi:hypothetical protein